MSRENKLTILLVFWMAASLVLACFAALYRDRVADMEQVMQQEAAACEDRVIATEQRERTACDERYAPPRHRAYVVKNRHLDNVFFILGVYDSDNTLRLALKVVESLDEKRPEGAPHNVAEF